MRGSSPIVIVLTAEVCYWSSPQGLFFPFCCDWSTLCCDLLPSCNPQAIKIIAIEFVDESERNLVNGQGRPFNRRALHRRPCPALNCRLRGAFVSSLWPLSCRSPSPPENVDSYTRSTLGSLYSHSKSDRKLNSAGNRTCINRGVARCTEHVSIMSQKFKSKSEKKIYKRKR